MCLPNQVPFQSNSYDCGIHTLWQLRHILEFGSVQTDCALQHLRFNNDMIGKCVRLVQEILDDCLSEWQDPTFL